MVHKRIIQGMRRLLNKEGIGLYLCEGYEIFPYLGAAIWKPCGYIILASIDQSDEELADTLVHEYIHVLNADPKVIEEFMKAASIEDAAEYSDADLEQRTIELTNWIVGKLTDGEIKPSDIRGLVQSP